MAFVNFNIDLSNFFECGKVQYRGIIFTKGSVIFSKRDEFSGVMFCVIKYIFVCKDTSEPFFIFYEQGAYENKDIGLYEMYTTKNSEIKYSKGSDFVDLTEHYKYIASNGSEYICIKHAIPF